LVKIVARREDCKISKKTITNIRLTNEQRENLDILLVILGYKSYQQFFTAHVDSSIEKYQEEIDMIKRIRKKEDK